MNQPSEEQEESTDVKKTQQKNEQKEKKEKEKTAKKEKKKRDRTYQDGNQKMHQVDPARDAALSKLHILEEYKKPAAKTTVLETSTRPPDALTENGAAAFSTSGSALLDLFFTGLVRNASYKKLEQQMQAAWEENPPQTVQLLFQARDCRQGKGEKKVVEHCLWWLRNHHPSVYLLNLRAFVSLGYHKDLLHLAARHYASPETPSLGQKECVELELFVQVLQEDYECLQIHVQEWAAYTQRKDVWKKEQHRRKKQLMKAAQVDAQKRLKAELRHAKKYGNRMYDGVPPFVWESKVAETLVTVPLSPEPEPPLNPPVSLAAKWAPSQGKSYHKLFRRMVGLLFPDLPLAAANKKYRHMISALRAHLRVLETALCKRQWKTLNFNTVPARAHHLYANAFRTHAPQQYEAYLLRVKKGTAKIHVTGVQPHELVAQYVYGHELKDTVEMQWQALLQSLRQETNGTLKGCLAMADVSDSMSGLPMTVSVALSLVVAQLTEGAFHNRVLSFDEHPCWHIIDDSAETTLFSRVKTMLKMPWGRSTNLSAAFRMIAEVGQALHVAPEDMPHTLFIFSDMQFNEAVTGEGITIFQEARATFAAAGYTLPRVVFWNLAGRIESFPVTQNEQGVAMVSGFSPNLLKAFLSGSDFSPWSILQEILAPYAKWVRMTLSDTKTEPQETKEESKVIKDRLGEP
jgi:hypothetical protein